MTESQERYPYTRPQPPLWILLLLLAILYIPQGVRISHAVKHTVPIWWDSEQAHNRYNFPSARRKPCDKTPYGTKHDVRLPSLESTGIQTQRDGPPKGRPQSLSPYHGLHASRHTLTYNYRPHRLHIGRTLNPLHIANSKCPI